MVTNLKRRRRNIKQLIGIVIVLAVAVFSYYYYFDKSKSSYTTVELVSPDGRQRIEFNVEEASTNATRSKGLMFRKELAAKNGMIFVYPEDRVLTFWMKNTYIPLDIVFVNSKFDVIGVLQNLTPLDTAPKDIGLPSKYAIEINAGLVSEFGIQAGWKMVWNRQN